MGANEESYCRYHRAYGHHTDDCRTLKFQIERLIQRGHLEEFTSKGRRANPRNEGRYERSRSPRRTDERREREGRRQEQDDHEKEIHGQISNIAGGPAGGGTSSSARKRYVRSGHVMHIEGVNLMKSGVSITLSDEDTVGVLPHKDDPLVISMVTSGYRIKRVLIDGGSSANVMFWPCFKDLKIRTDALR